MNRWTGLLIIVAAVAACEGPMEPEPAEVLPTTGTLTFKVTVPLPEALRPRYFEGAKVFVEYENSSQRLTYSMSDTILVLERMPLGGFRAAFLQPRVDGWGDKTPGADGSPFEWEEGLFLGRTGLVVEHVAKYDASMSGTGYLSGCIRDSGGHCHRDRWRFQTGPVADNGSFTGETHVILVDRFFQPDTVASGSVSGVYEYPKVMMTWDVFGGCEVSGELRHVGQMPVQKLLKVDCPGTELDREGWFN